MTSPLRIGILGAARIADDGIVAPAGALGHELVCVAARDPIRAEAFAADRGIGRVHATYADVVADPDVGLVYNALVNSAHIEWNLAALAAGKHVLSEKPLASNADQARAVRDAAKTSVGTIVEGFHYLHHPVNRRLGELVTSGVLGEITGVDLVLAIPSPPDGDPRWSLELSGGATMDLGCYVLSAARQVRQWLGSDLDVVSAEATLRAPEMDAAMRVTLAYDGVPATCLWDMDAEDRTMTWTVTGTKGTATSMAFAVPHLDNRLELEIEGVRQTEVLGDATSYTYQLAALAETIRSGATYPFDIEESVANAELVDRCYELSGLTPRKGRRT
jgi:predicted dehydrogenase